ncbi:hypothetical protein [Steroidobacter cummioxidans]|uniref:hypothetical protein n=1 Tax=Steroidobacter cummioxidans TaxID=1803913 RepID=UPI000E317CF7|nr:hypothetical protein [Steroidobacter cummioxidans]
MDRIILEKAFGEFLDERARIPTLRDFPLPYDICDKVHMAEWPHFMGLAISADVRETINSLNAWGRHLTDWAAWLIVFPKYKENDAMTIQMYCAEAPVFFCMVQPSATRDRFIRIATTAIHQMNIQTDSGYADKLDEDKEFLTRRKREKQLATIGTRWQSYAEYQRRFTLIDGHSYRETTRDFRNRASHTIAPRFERGITNLVTRKIVSATEMQLQSDGTYKRVKIPGKKAIQYGFGGTAALKLEDMRQANLNEFMLAQNTMRAYEALLDELIAASPKSK